MYYVTFVHILNEIRSSIQLSTLLFNWNVQNVRTHESWLLPVEFVNVWEKKLINVNESINYYVLFFWINQNKPIYLLNLEGNTCRLQDGSRGVCKNIEQCQSITDAIARSTIRFDNIVVCSFLVRLRLADPMNGCTSFWLDSN